MKIHLRCLISLGSCQNTVTEEFLELTRLTICTKCYSVWATPKMSHLWSFMYRAMLRMNICWPLDHIIQSTMEKSFTSDLEMQDSNLRQIEAPCVPQPTTTVSESFLGWNNAWIALHALRNQPNEWEVLLMPPDVSPGKSILNLLKSYTWKEKKETDKPWNCVSKGSHYHRNKCIISLQPLGR